MENMSICPLDSRYLDEIKDIADIWNEDNVLWEKLQVEQQYLQALVVSRPSKIGDNQKLMLGYIAETFKVNQETDKYRNLVLKEIRIIEKTTKHEIKAIEYFMRQELMIEEIGGQSKIGKIGSQLANYVHFGLTSEDIISITNSRLIQLSYNVINSYIYKIHEIFDKFGGVSDCAMAARTHGQLAIPTSFYKQLENYRYRLNFISTDTNPIIYCKMGGAIGDLYSLKLVDPEFKWEAFFDDFCSGLGLQRLDNTTQVDNGLSYNHILHSMNQVCRILIDFCQDMWQYHSYSYFVRKKVDGEIGSSTMPQKINPIKFENAEGNAKIASMWFNFLMNELPVSRMQRDLSGSTIMRNLGVPFGYMLVSIKNILTGMKNLEISREHMQADLIHNHEMIFEYIQLLLKDNGYPKAYELFNNNFAKRQSISRNELIEFIDSLQIDSLLKDKIRDFDITKINQ